MAKTKKEAAQSIADSKQYKRDHKIVRGRFNYKERPGCKLRFFYCKYGIDQVKTYEMQDGEIYEVPLMVAEHLNTSGIKEVHKYAMDKNGVPLRKVGQKVRRYGFENVDFDSQINVTMTQPSDIVTVENIIAK